MRLFWSAWVECLCCFLVAEYGQSDRARQDCDELWLGLSLKPDLLNDPTTLEVCALLEEFEYLAIAQRIRCDLATGAAPTLDAWRGLKVALKVLGQNDQNAEHQWVEVVTDCCVGLQSGDFKDIENRAARSKARLETLKRDAQQAGIESHFKLGLILLDHLLSLVAQKQGKYSFADSLFSQANREWLSVPMHLRAQGPWVRLYLNAALENGCPFLAENFPVQLYNPGGEKHGMVQLGAAAAPLLGQEDWQECLTRAWAWAREGKHDVALRSAATAERSARKVSIRNLKVALALNTQAAISWLMGSYAEGLASYRESLSMWNMEEADEALVTRFVIAVEAGWPELAEKLKVRRSAGLPVLVDPDADLSSVEMTRWKRAELPDATLPDEATTRKSKTGGWFAQLKGMLSRREKLDD